MHFLKNIGKNISQTASDIGRGMSMPKAPAPKLNVQPSSVNVRPSVNIGPSYGPRYGSRYGPRYGSRYGPDYGYNYGPGHTTVVHRSSSGGAWIFLVIIAVIVFFVLASYAAKGARERREEEAKNQAAPAPAQVPEPVKKEGFFDQLLDSLRA